MKPRRATVMKSPRLRSSNTARRVKVDPLAAVSAPPSATASASASERLAWFPWYTGDFLAETWGWPLIARAVYRELIDVQWQHGVIDADARRLQQLVQANAAQWRIAWPLVGPKFPLRDGGRINPTIARHREERFAIRARRRAAAEETNRRLRRTVTDTVTDVKRDGDRHGERHAFHNHNHREEEEASRGSYDTTSSSPARSRPKNAAASATLPPPDREPGEDDGDPWPTDDDYTAEGDADA